MNTPAFRLTLIGTALMAGCSQAPSLGQADAATRPADGDRAAYRLRTDFDADLNADGGWLADSSGPVTVVADQPFRLRMELAPSVDVDADCVRLQYRRNDGEWTAVEAHDFPYPLRERELTFETGAAGMLPEGWRVAAGSVDGVAVAEVDGNAVLQASAPGAALIGLYPAPWNLQDAFGFTAEYQLAKDAGAGGAEAVGLVFGYVDTRNHWRLMLDAETGTATVIRVDDGSETVLAEQPAGVRGGAWQQAEVELEAGSLQISIDDDAAEFSLAVDENLPAEQFGFFVPAGGEVRFRSFAIEGEPSSPRVSIVSTGAYADNAITRDLLDGSAEAFVAGVGVNLDECAPASVPAGRHSEIEWPLVIRRFADAALLNESGDTFAFRMTHDGGRVLQGAPQPELILEVPSGHLGGTFVEAPGRLGPWQADNGDLYFIMEPAESDNLFMVVKSTDGGRSWYEVDGGNRPDTGDLESVDSRLVGDTLHILHQVTESTRYHAFRTSDHPGAPDTWAVTDELAAPVTASHNQMATLVVRPDGSMVAFHSGDTIGYSIRSTSGEWGAETVIEEHDAALVGPQAVLGADGVVHLAYYAMDGSIWYRRLLPDDTLTPAVRLDEGAGTGEDDWGAVLPLVYLPASDTVVVVYRLADGRLWERRITGDRAPAPPVVAVERPVVQNAVDSQQAGADAVAHDGGVVVMFIDANDRYLYSTVDAGGGWQPPVLQVDGILGSWVRGNVFRRADGATVYGYVYDAGSYGGAGMNRYGELVLETP